MSKETYFIFYQVHKALQQYPKACEEVVEKRPNHPKKRVAD